jgi:enterochelin esterase family protein
LCIIGRAPTRGSGYTVLPLVGAAHHASRRVPPIPHAAAAQDSPNTGFYTYTTLHHQYLFAMTTSLPSNTHHPPCIQVQTQQLISRQLGRTVTLTLYYPTQLPAPTQAPPHLLLLNDGQDAEQLRLLETLQTLTATNQIAPLWVAAIHAANRVDEYGVPHILDFKRRGHKAPQYAAFLFHELLPFIRFTARQQPFQSLNFAGFSLGALSALSIAWQYPGVFSKVGAFSGSFWWRSKSLGKHYDDNKHRIAHQLIRQGTYQPQLSFWFQVGTNDELADRNNNGIIDAMDDTLDLIRELKHKGYSDQAISYNETLHGEHNFNTWSVVFPQFLRWAFATQG